MNPAELHRIATAHAEVAAILSHTYMVSLAHGRETDAYRARKNASFHSERAAELRLLAYYREALETERHRAARLYAEACAALDMEVSS